MIGATTIPLRMATMIAAHRYASELMADASHEDEMQRTAAASSALARATKAEVIALQALLKHHPASMHEATDRLEYLFSKDGPWHDFRPSATESGWLIASMREVEVAQIPHAVSHAFASEEART